MVRPRLLDLDELVGELEGRRAHVWSLARFRTRAERRLGVTAVDGPDALPEDAEVLVALGGGALLDEAKLWRRNVRPELTLYAIPSVWGSGAEASPVVALNRDGGKLIELSEELLPDGRAIWVELAYDLPIQRAIHACGDTWSHALEGFLSPLASAELRAEIAPLFGRFLELGINGDADWFEPSAQACAAQARASVGLVHGIAHVLEGSLVGRKDTRFHADAGFGHARLCALCLAPVMALNRQLSPKFDDFTAEHGVDGVAVLAALDELFDAADWQIVLPVLEERWRDVLRDPCTRTNSALVRPQHLAFFQGYEPGGVV